MDDKELKDILEKHRKWVYGKDDGECANLSCADLKGANLKGANLKGADLSYGNLSDADLSCANLKSTNLTGADLKSTNLTGAYLRGANLRSTDLRCADLRYADLRGANLRSTDLRYADLRYADLRGANLENTNLNETDLSNADLNGVTLNNIIVDNLTTGYFLVCPEKGSFIGFKKVNGYIIELEIPSNAKRSSATSRKCRCEFAKVLSITNIDGSDSGLTEVINCNYKKTIYKVGEMVYPDSFDENRWKECSNGIHFFITREEAVLF